jgi:ABC-type glycerol-3-phosphate transport system permease component
VASSAHTGTVIPARPARHADVDRLTVRRFAMRATRYTIMLVLAVFFLLPYVWMVSGSLRTQNEIFANLFPLSIWTFIPKQWTLASYEALLQLRPFPFTHYVLNSLFVAITVTALSLIVNSCAAYVFARIRFPGRDPLFIVFLATMVIPFEVLAIPLYLEMRALHWTDTYQALIVPFIASPLGMFLLRQFFLGLPRELEEAARIDGCSLFGAFWRVILPNATPALIAFGLIRFQFSWDAFIWPLMVAPSPPVRVIQVAIASFDSDQVVRWDLIFAAAVLASLPIVVLFALLQRYYVQGVVTSGLK